MSTNRDDLNDSLDDMLGGAIAGPRPALPAHYQPLQPTAFTEPCKKCGGSGNWRPGYPCFACKGAGKKTFKTAPDDREVARRRASAKRVERSQAIEAEARAWNEEHKAKSEWLARTAKRNMERGGTFGFPQAMINAAAKFGSLTDNQLAAVRKLMVKDAARDQERDAAKPSVNVSKLEAAFEIAKAKAKGEGAMGIKRLHLRLQSGDHSLSFSPGSPGSEWAGMVFVREAGKDGEKLGYVKDGKFTRRFACTDAQSAAIFDACTDPLKAALAYGQKWSQCAVCGRELTNGVSIKAAMGPICRAKYGWEE